MGWGQGDKFQSFSFHVELIYDSDDLIGIKITKFGKEILVPFIDNSKTENNNLLENYSKVDCLVTDDYEFWKELEINVIDITKNELVFL